MEGGRIYGFTDSVSYVSHTHSVPPRSRIMVCGDSRGTQGWHLPERCVGYEHVYAWTPPSNRVGVCTPLGGACIRVCSTPRDADHARSPPVRALPRDARGLNMLCEPFHVRVHAHNAIGGVPSRVGVALAGGLPAMKGHAASRMQGLWLGSGTCPLSPGGGEHRSTIPNPGWGFP